MSAWTIRVFTEAAVEIPLGHSGAPASRAGLERFVKMVSRNKLYFRCSCTLYILVKKNCFWNTCKHCHFVSCFEMVISKIAWTLYGLSVLPVYIIVEKCIIRFHYVPSFRCRWVFTKPLHSWWGVPKHQWILRMWLSWAVHRQKLWTRQVHIYIYCIIVYLYIYNFENLNDIPSSQLICLSVSISFMVCWNQMFSIL